MIQNIFKNDLLTGKTIIIAGASSGIGSSTAFDISKLKGNVILIARNTDKLKRVFKKLINNRDQNHYYYSCDLSNFDSTYELFQKIKNNHKSIDGLIWSAGTELIKLSRLTTESDIKNTFGTIYNGLISAAKVFCSKNFWNELGGSIILISSVSSIRSNDGMLVYSAAKASLSGVSKSLSLDLNKYNTRINNLLLGAVKTEMHKRITKNFRSDTLTDYRNKHLLGFGNLNDVTPMIIFLLSDASRWMTGSDIILDGGFTIK